MRKCIKKLFVILLAITLIMPILPEKTSNAASTQILDEIPVVTVEDLSDPTIDIQGKEVTLSGSTEDKQIFSFTLEKSGKVRLGASAVNATDSSYELGLAYNSSTTNLVSDSKMQLIFFTDHDAEYKDLYLDKGTYYIYVIVDCYEMGLDHRGEAHPDMPLTLSVGLEPSKDVTGKTSIDKPYSLKLNTNTYGFFTDLRREQYYKFNITKNNQLVTVAAWATKTDLNDTWSHKDYTIDILNKNKKSLKSFSGNKSSINAVSKIYLNKGTYYIKLTANDKIYAGDTCLKVTTQTKSPITLKVNTTKPTKKVVITVTTGTKIDTLRWVAGNVPNSKLKDGYTWNAYDNKNTIKKYKTVTKNGTYSFRLVDVYGNWHMKTIKITNIKK